MNDSWHQNVKSKNRKEIISAGRELFLKNNFLNVNVKDICILACVSRVTFYKHFKSMDELIFEVQMGILNNMTDFIIARDNIENNGLERIKKILYSWIDFAKQFKDEMKFIILFDLYYEDYDTDKELKNKYENFINEENNRDFLYLAINKGIEDKSLRPNLDPIKTGYYIFQTIIAVLQRMIYTKLSKKYGVVSFDDIVFSVVDMIINSIKNTNINRNINNN
ncbi:TetR/AcrR family transcriptional regulator [Clostridium saccharobutylicum]|uniref:Bacterial regulatory protein, tetR family n=1 Tax=Clostridium saccharobutylicum TaxID=169679 RepID=A0A1S8NJV4_CLOSA|nr:TetR/AcrR family transcriptional regulator [Clostridium saccharobutylicum]OOM16730.1 bacterial regulatory protein, tetR family [Clostridium saccharobutylicum]